MFLDIFKKRNHYSIPEEQNLFSLFSHSQFNQTIRGLSLTGELPPSQIFPLQEWMLRNPTSVIQHSIHKSMLMVHDPPIQQHPLWRLGITQSSVFISSYQFLLKDSYKCIYQLLILTVKANNCFSHLKGDIPLWQQKRFTWIQLEERNCNNSTIKYLCTCPSLGKHFRALHPKKLLISKGLGANLTFTVSLAQTDSLPIWQLPDLK